MAIKVTRKVVCDHGERHSGTIRNWRITVDGESKTFDLCPTCSKGLQRLWARGGEARQAPARMRIHTLSEIEAQKREAPPTL